MILFIMIVVLLWMLALIIFTIIDTKEYDRPRNTIKPTDYATHWHMNYRKNDGGGAGDMSSTPTSVGMNWEHIRHMDNQRAMHAQTQAIREQTQAIRQEGASARHPENYMDRVVKGEW